MLRFSLLICCSLLASFVFSQDTQPGFRGWVYCSPPPTQIDQATTVRETNHNRAHLAWYTIDPAFYYGNTDLDFPESNLANHYMRQVTPNEVFPHATNIVGDNLYSTFNLHFDPTRRGPYNYNVYPSSVAAGIDSTGQLIAPETRWAGIMRHFNKPDLPAQDIEAIDFWVLDPFIYTPNHAGVTMTFQLGDVSEDALRDGIRAVEQALVNNLDSTEWGPYSLVPACVPEFPDDAQQRAILDVGLDGLSDAAERDWVQSVYLDQLANTFGTSSGAYLQAWADPSADNFRHFSSSTFQGASIAERYTDINGMEGNSAELVETAWHAGFTSHPDLEDISGNCTLNTAEETQDYALRLTPGMQGPQPYLVDSLRSEVRLINGEVETVTWYHFSIPLVTPGSNLTLDDFRNVFGLRVLLSDAAEPVTLRIAGSRIFKVPAPDYSVLFGQEYTATPFPNPFIDALGFQFEKLDECPQRLEMWDVLGRKVVDYQDFGPDGKYYPDAGLRPAVYIYRVHTVDNISGRPGLTYTGRVVKVR